MNRISSVLAVALLGLTACGAAEDAGSGRVSRPRAPSRADRSAGRRPRIVCDGDGAARRDPLRQAAARRDPFRDRERDRQRALRRHRERPGHGRHGRPAGHLDADRRPRARRRHRSLHDDPSDGARRARGARGRRRGRHLGLDAAQLRRPVLEVVDYIQGAAGETTDPLEAARKAVEGFGLEPDDVFERAGYPDTDVARVRMVRDGEPIAIVDLIDDGTGKWL